MDNIIKINSSELLDINEYVKINKRSDNNIELINPNYANNKIRILSDTSTGSFTNVFLNNINDKRLFIDYVYNKINSDIKINLHNNLIKSNNLPLNGNEYVKFLFKGGNLFKTLYDNYLDSVDLQRRALKLAQIRANNYHTSFITSDNDFSLLIIADNNIRYDIIKQVATEIIYDSLQDISAFFNNLYINKVIRNQPTNLIPFPLQQNNPDTLAHMTVNNILINRLNRAISGGKIICHELSKNKTFYKKLILDANGNLWQIVNVCSNVVYMNIGSNGILNYINNNNANNILTIIREIIMIRNYIRNFRIINTNTTNMHILQLSLELLDYVFTIDNILGDKIFTIPRHTYNDIKRKIEKKINLYKLRLSRNNFYSLAKFNAFIVDLRNQLRLITNVNLYENKNGRIITYRVNNIATTGNRNLIISKSDDSIIYPDNSKNKIVVNNIKKPYNYHKVSANFLIYKTHDYANINFDLLRIKFNIKLTNKLTVNGNRTSKNIPSEFIDISIPHYNDTTNSSTLKNYTNYTQFIEYNNVLLETYNNNYVVKDFEYIFFYQNYWTPILDGKYRKRLIRYVFFQYNLFYSLNGINNAAFNVNLNDILNIMLNIFLNIASPIIVDAHHLIIANGLFANDISLINLLDIYKNIDLKNIIIDRIFPNSHDYLLIQLLKNVILMALIYKLNDNDALLVINHFNDKYKLENLQLADVPGFKIRIRDYIELVNNLYDTWNQIFLI
jgi:hypothetical protein